MYRANFSEETALWNAGYAAVAGVDEAGTGAWAGPVVAAAAILPGKVRLPFVQDSKVLSSAQRERVFAAFADAGILYATGVVSVAEINRMSIRAAALLAMQRAVAALAVAPAHLLVDAFHIPNITIPQRAIIHGDRLVKSIAAASIVAKVTRDRLMCKLHIMYPLYGLATHKGYGTALHQRALMMYGPSTVHRLRFTPVLAATRRKMEKEADF
jgi:ribonuclease HII